MKKWLLSMIALVSIFTLAGCNNGDNTKAAGESITIAKTYKQAMTDGKTAVDDVKYGKAEGFFQTALSLKAADKKAKAYLQQVIDIQDAQTDMDNAKYTEAQDKLKSVISEDNGLAKLVSQAKTLQTKIKDIKAKSDIFQAAIDDAQKLSDGKQYAESNTKLQTIYKDADSTDTYYETYITKANSLKQKNLEALAAAASTATSSSASSNPAAGGEYQPTESDTTLNGKTITKEQIQTARQQLKDQGVNPAYWSDLDIMRAIKNAAKDGRTTITEKDA